jgi:hypothetical protein
MLHPSPETVSHEDAASFTRRETSFNYTYDLICAEVICRRASPVASGYAAAVSYQTAARLDCFAISACVNPPGKPSRYLSYLHVILVVTTLDLGEAVPQSTFDQSDIS